VLLGDFDSTIDMTKSTCAVVLTWGMEVEQDMKKTLTSSEPSWLDPRNDRKTPLRSG